MILTMIVKNEVEVVADAILSAHAAGCSHYAIVDTGSADGTPELVQNAADGLGMVGRIVVDNPWAGFADARNRALALADQVAGACPGAGRYALMLDADDVVETMPMTTIGDLIEIHAGDAPPHAGYHTTMRLGDLSYARVNVFRLGCGWRYRGVVHEFPELPPTADSGRTLATLGLDIPTHPNLRSVSPYRVATIRAGVHGARSRDPLKYLHDADAISKALHVETDQSLRNRYCFYLAQSYRDAAHSGAAIYWYERVWEAQGWSEERYIAALNLGRLTGDATWFVRAGVLNPRRAEAWRALGQAALADACRPSDDFLFMETGAYHALNAS